MAKEIFYDADARSRIEAGAKKLADAVRVTMGPKGRNVVIGRSYGVPSVTHDGVTVAKAVELKQTPETLGESHGAELIKQAASKTNDTVGDGTTTSTILAYELLKEANKLITAGTNAMILKRELDEAAQVVLEAIDQYIEQIAGDPAKIAEVATISGEDAHVGKLIAEIFEAIGPDGSVTVEPSQTLEIEKQVVEGYKLERGFTSPYFMTDIIRQEAIMNNPLFLLTTKAISQIADLQPLIQSVVESQGNNLVIIAEDVNSQALAVLIQNKVQGAFQSVVVKAPMFGPQRKEMLEDIAALTGATLITEESGIPWDQVTREHLGNARKVVSGTEETTIIEPLGKPSVIDARIAQLKGHATSAKSEFDKERTEKRLAALAGKVAVIKVGGATEAEVEERKYRVDDAVAATKAAAEGGIVPGGGVVLVKIAQALIGKEQTTSNPSQGRVILYEALQQPFKQLMSNAGLNAESLIEKVREAKAEMGIDVMTGKLVDLKKAGIIDPAKVTREAIINAVSVAGVAMTMGCLVVEIPEPVAK